MKRDLSIETRTLRRVFKGIPGAGDVVALDSVDLAIEEGEIFGLLGPNGAGKTTMIKILATLLLPTSGEAYVKGLEVSKNASKVRKVINLVSVGETPGYGILSVKENLWFFSQLYGLSRQAANDRLKAKIASRPSWKIEVTPNIQELDTLKTVPGVIGISEVSNIETGTSTLKLVLEDESVMSDLLSTISKNGSRVLNMGKSEPTLEDVYINLVGKGLQ